MSKPKAPRWHGKTWHSTRSWARTVKQCIDEKWVPISEDREEDEGSANCALCRRAEIESEEVCLVCPVELTGGYGCAATPYMAWKRHQVHECHGSGACPVCHKIALAEVAYLQRLHGKMLRWLRKHANGRAVT